MNIRIVSLVGSLVLLGACDEYKSDCEDKNDIVACNNSCDGPGTKSSCKKRILIATEVCAGKKTNAFFKDAKEACDRAKWWAER